MTSETLRSIADQLDYINKIFTEQNSSKTVLDFPADFEVMSDDGYSLGKFVTDDNAGSWIFMAYETGE